MQRDDLTPSLQRELEEMARFCTSNFYGQQQRPVSQITSSKYIDHIRYGVTCM